MNTIPWKRKSYLIFTYHSSTNKSERSTNQQAIANKIVVMHANVNINGSQMITPMIRQLPLTCLPIVTVFVLLWIIGIGMVLFEIEFGNEVSENIFDNENDCNNCKSINSNIFSQWNCCFEM